MIRILLFSWTESTGWQRHYQIIHGEICTLKAKAMRLRSHFGHRVTTVIYSFRVALIKKKEKKSWEVPNSLEPLGEILSEYMVCMPFTVAQNQLLRTNLNLSTNYLNGMFLKNQICLFTLRDDVHGWWKCHWFDRWKSAQVSDHEEH